MELFRDDTLPEGFEPAMAYLSVTHPGIARGPHEHREQSDGFCFLSGTFRLSLWENRPNHSPCKETYVLGEDNACFVVVPPGVVHAYENIGTEDAFVLNLPDRLYAGRGRKDPVDEIRHEDEGSPFAQDLHENARAAHKEK
jgi:dTDP-4-dehydrorhamnose 3,5-epimerase